MKDMNIKETVDIIAKKQYYIAKREVENNSIGYSNVNDILLNIFKKATNSGYFNPLITGSDLVQYPILYQLFTQFTALRDLSCDELNKETPFNMPIQSLVKLALYGHIYLNLIDYNYGNDQYNQDYIDNKLNEKGRENLELLLDNLVKFNSDGIMTSKIYIMSAMRKPIFEKLARQQNSSFSYSTFQIECLERIRNAEFAYEKCLQNGIDFPPFFKRFKEKRPQNAISASFHYAYLKSANIMISRNFDNRNIFGNDSNYNSFEILLNECEYLGKKWTDNVNSPENLEFAGRAFAKFAHYLRVFHENYTIQITGSWGCVWNRPIDVFYRCKSDEADFFNNNKKEKSVPISQTDEFKRIIANLMCKNSNNKGLYTKALDMSNQSTTGFSEEEIDKFIETMYTNEIVYKTLGREMSEIDNFCENGRNIDFKKVQKKIDTYNNSSSNLINKLLNTLNLSLNMGIISISIPNKATISSIINGNKYFKNLFLGSPENKLVFRLHKIFS